MMSRMYSDSFAQGTQIGQQRAGMGLDALISAQQQEQAQQMAAIRQQQMELADREFTARVDAQNADGEIAVALASGNFGAISPSLLRRASDRFKDMAVNDRSMQGYRKANALFQQYRDKFDRAPAEVLRTLREYHFDVPGVDDLIASLHGDAAGNRARQLQAQLAASGIQLDDAMIGEQLAPHLQLHAGKNDAEFDAGLKDVLRDLATAAIQRQQQVDIQAVQRGEMDQAAFAAKYGTPMNALAQVEQQQAAQTRAQEAARTDAANRVLLGNRPEAYFNADPSVRGVYDSGLQDQADATARGQEEARKASEGTAKAASQSALSMLGNRRQQLEGVAEQMELRMDNAKRISSSEGARATKELGGQLQMVQQQIAVADQAQRQLDQLVKDPRSKTMSDTKWAQQLPQIKNTLAAATGKRLSDKEAIEWLLDAMGETTQP